MTAPLFPAGAAEFPNDNPALHDGARWVCPDTIGPARAIVRPRPGGGAIPVVAGAPGPAAAARPAAAPPERRYEGPLQLDLGRVLLLHRVEDIPPPPDFIFRPFVSSRRREVPLSEAVVAALAADPSRGGVCADLVAAPIEPRPCRAVDEREACRRVDRGWRVDVAPCLNIGEGLRARARRRALSTSRAALPSAPRAEELEAASA